MMSNKWAFSLTTLITIFALAFVVTPAMAGEFKTTLSGDGTIDAGQDIDVTIKFDKEVTLAAVQAIKISLTIVRGDFTTATAAITGAALADDTDTTLDETTTDLFSVVMQKDTDASMAGDQFDGKTFKFTIGAAATAADPDGTPPVAAATKIHVSIPAGIASLDPANADTSAAATQTIDLRKIMAPPADTPRVVSIQRLRPGSQLVVSAFEEERVTGAFDVRIVLTEKHPALKDGMKVADIKKHIEIENGEPSNLRVGFPFSRIGPVAANGSIGTTERAGTTKPHPTEGMYWHDLSGALVGQPRPMLSGTTQDAATALAQDQLVPLPTGADNMYHQYRVTITPHAIKGDPTKTFDAKIKVKNFNNGGSPTLLTYVSPGFGDSVRLPNGRDILTVAVSYTKINLKAGYRVHLAKDIIIPAGGFLVITKSSSGSAVVVPNDGDDTHPEAEATTKPNAVYRTPAQMLYNVKQEPTLPNLATAFLNGVVLDLENAGANVDISEVMWGEDVSLVDRTHSQYIELYNSGSSDFKTPDDKASTPEIDERLTLIFYAPNEFDDVPAAGADGALPDRVSDRVGTLDAKGAYWDPSDIGQNGASGIINVGATDIERTVAPTAIIPVVSMYRVMADATMLADGQMEASWKSSRGPKSANFDPIALGVRHGTPGAATDATDTPADAEAAAKAKAAEQKAIDDKAAAEAEKIRNTGTIPTAGRIYISEIMFAGGGILPQWIEIANGSATEDVNLSGWTLTIANAVADADVSIGASATFTIPNGTMIDRSRQEGATKTPSTILIVTEQGRNNIDTESEQVINLKIDNEVELINAGVTKRKYTLLSDEAFLITLAPPEPEKSTPPKGETADAKAKRMAQEREEAAMRKEATDMAGNLDADGTAAWALPMSEHGRSSIIRSHVNVRIGPAEPEGETPKGSDGPLSATRETDWVLASNTAFEQATHIRQETYYGAMSDEGTPGFRAGGALPVELSHFRPARDKVTDAVVITWATESELNNAGFFIKRSNQRDGEFKVINAAMVPGAGTTSEKQFYTYTDTTAQPNVVYYYQIEDVSLDGNRQTLTRGIRLKGHVGAAGKATTLWGELKTSHE